MSEATYPRVVDAHAEAPKAIHVRGTHWGCGWPPDAPAFCGARPVSYWCQVGSHVTCEDCAAFLPAQPVWKDVVLAIADGLLLADGSYIKLAQAQWKVNR